jgi:hypothetical protein
MDRIPLHETQATKLYLFCSYIIAVSCIYTEQLRLWVSIDVKNINRKETFVTKIRWLSQASRAYLN